MIGTLKMCFQLTKVNKGKIVLVESSKAELLPASLILKYFQMKDLAGKLTSFMEHRQEFSFAAVKPSIHLTHVHFLCAEPSP